MGESGTEQSTLGRNSFVGRERELAELVSACDSGAESDSHLFLIYGEPGIGKTRLVDELASRAKARDIEVLWGRCWEGDGAPAYWPWIQVIRSFLGTLDPQRRSNLAVESDNSSDILHQVAQIVPDLRPALTIFEASVTEKIDPSEARFRLFDAVANFLKMGARSHPMLIVLDDLHDADETSLALLRFMARELKGSGIMLVATYREAEVRRSPSLSKLIGDLSREAHSIPISGLNESEVTKLVEFRAGRTPDPALVAKLCAATNGNPLFVDGLVRNLLAEGFAGALDRPFKIPSGIREAIRNRLDGLSQEANSVLSTAAAIGNEFEFNLCQSLAGVPTADAYRFLDEAARDGIVVSLGNGRYRFSHALIRGAVYEDLDTNSRVRIHTKIANRLEETYRENLDPHLAELAHHFREAGESEKAIEYSQRAAKAATAVFAHAVAAEHLREAIALSEGQNDARRAATLVRLGRLEVFHFDGAEGAAHLEAALSIYRKLGDGKKIAATNAFLGLALSSQPDFSPGANIIRALECCYAALAWEGEWTDPGIFGWLHYGLAKCLYQASRIDEAIAVSVNARQVFDRDSHPAWILATSEHAKLLVIKGKHRQAKAVFDEVFSRVRGTLDPDPDLLVNVSQQACWCSIVMRNPSEAKRLITDALERKRFPTDGEERIVEQLALAELLSGDLTRAKAIAAEHRMMPSNRSQIALREGEWEFGIEMARTMLEWSRRVGHRWDETISLAWLSQLLRVSGDLERAEDSFRQTQRLYAPSDLSWEMRMRPEAAFCAIEAGRPEDALEHLQVCRGIIAQGEDWLGLAGLSARAEGMFAATQGHNFATHFESAIATFRRYALPWDEADALHDWGVALNTAGGCSNANEKFDAAIAIYRRHGGGQRWLDRVEAARRSSVPSSKSHANASMSHVARRFRKEGEFWTITYSDTTFRLKDAKGLHYLAYLLGRPGQRIHVYDLIEAVEGSASNGRTTIHAASEDLEIVRDVSGSGPTIDGRARSEYRARLRDLQGELDEAERMNDLGRSERLRSEIEMVGEELTRSSGLGGHARSASSSAERARGLVGKNIRSALEKIRQQHSGLGRHFATAISTGYFCVYQPDPDHPISWQL